MPISFTCECGRSYSVADNLAGKRTKCASCAAPLTVPKPVADSPEDEAFAALTDGPELQRKSYAPDPPPMPPPMPLRPPEPPLPPEKKTKAKVKKKRVDSADDRPSGISISPTILGGLGMMVLFGGLLAWRWSEGRISPYLAFLTVVGAFTVVKGLMGYED